MILPFLILLAFLAAGMALARFFPEWAPRLSRWSNRWVIRAALPALVFQKIHGLSALDFSSPEIWIPISMPWLHWFLSLGVITFLSRRLGWSRSVWGAMALTLGLGNTSFVGFPLLRAILGEESLVTGVLLDQLGSFLILSAVALPLVLFFSPRAQSTSAPKLIWRALSFPPFVALVAAFLWRSLEWGQTSSRIIGFLSQTLAPIALISVGLSSSLADLREKEIQKPLWIGVGLKLFLFPILYLGIYPTVARLEGGISPLTLQTTLLEGCMASMITAGVVAVENDFAPRLAQLMVSVSILLSLITVPLWGVVIRQFF